MRACLRQLFSASGGRWARLLWNFDTTGVHYLDGVDENA